MKMLSVNRILIVSIFVGIVLIFGGQSISYSQEQDNAPELTAVCDRTQQVRDAIVAIVPGVDDCKDVTSTHLAVISNLNLSNQEINALKAGDFDGLSALTSLSIGNNQLTSLPTNIFSGLSSLTRLDLGSNKLSSLHEDIFSGLTLLNRIYLSYNNLSSLPEDIFSGLSSLQSLALGNNNLSSLPAGIFSGLSSLDWLTLSSNSLSQLPDGIFSGLSSLRSLSLTENSVDLSITVSLEKVGDNQFKAVTPIGAPFTIVLPLTISNGGIIGDATTITISTGSVESDLLNVARTPDTTAPVTVEIGTLPSLPTSHYGYRIVKPTTTEEDDNTLSFALALPDYQPTTNTPPVFIEGDSTTRSVPENTPPGVNIGGPVSAEDTESDLLTYTLGGVDAASFGIDSGTGQLKTSAPLDYETKTAYSVIATVSDGHLTDTINVTIDVTDVDENNAPVFTEGDSTSRSVAENTPAGENIGAPVVATDLDEEDVLTYSLGGVDAASFSLESTTGQLLTKAPLDYETKHTYVVVVSVSDGKGGTDTISVTIYVTDLFENNPPVFTEGDSTSRSVAENTPAGENIGAPVVATDLDEEDVLTYSLGGVDAASFSLESTTGQLLTKVLLDYETKHTYVVVVSVSDGKGGTDSISVTIYVTDLFENNAPIFTEGDSTSRSIAENTPAGKNIGAPVVATDLDEEDVLTYSLGGVDVVSFSIDAATGQLLTRALLDYESKNSYYVTVSVSDGKGGTDIISVDIYVTDIDEEPTQHPPVFIEGDSTTRTIAENTPAGENVGGPVVATDLDEDILTYSLGGDDAASFGIDAATGQLLTKAPLDYETKDTYSVVATVSDGYLTDTISVTINVTDIYENSPPVFVDGETTTRSIVENTPAGENIGGPVIATDLDEDVLTYTLSGVDAATFSIDAATGQLLTHAPLDYETKDTYTVSVSVSDGKGGTDIISVTINVTDIYENRPPVFADGGTTIRSIVENTPAGRNIGDPVTATDPDEDDTLTYSLGGTDAPSFGIGAATGQLLTHAPLDFETKATYTVTVTVSDGSQSVTVVVTIIVIDVDESRAPAFADDRTTRSIAENTPAGVNIGSPVTATDSDGDTLTYSLEGADAATFSIVSSTGQLKTHEALDFETRNSYTVTVTVSDGRFTASITVTIIIIDIDETPPPEPEPSRVSISEIMYGSERRFTPNQWIELHNAGPDIINLAGWKLIIQNVDSPELTGPVNMTITFRDDFWDDAPRIWPNDVVMVVGSSDSHSDNLIEDQIYDLRWRTSLPISLWTTWLSAEGFRIKLYDDEGNLIDDAGNLDGDTLLWKLPYGQNRGKTRAGHRTSLIRRYADSMPLDGIQAASWISAADANLTPDLLTYYGDSGDISTVGVGIVINDISSQYTEYDINQDGVVDIRDLVIVAARIGQSGPNPADVNGDGLVNIQDLILVAGAIGQTSAAPSLQPASVAMLTVADIQEWLTAAQGLDLADVKLQSGIRFLEQLLEVLIPQQTELLPNFPNPFNPETWIPYRLAEDAFVILTIYDQRGVVIRRLNVGHKTAAVYETRSSAIYWDGKNEVGDNVASGIYFYTLTAGNYTATRKMLILK